MDFYFYRVPVPTILFILAIATAATLAVRSGKLTAMAGFAGFTIAFTIYAGSGIAGVLLLGLFFGLGTLATAHGNSIKATITDDNNGGRRTAGQVIANGGVAGVCGLLSYVVPQYSELFIFMLAASLSSATADTLSSELGTLYGKRFYNILTFRKDIRGENGVVSLEGTLLGIGGSTLIASAYCVSFGWDWFVLIVVAGTVGNLADSVLGAALERKGYIKNNAVNLLNTIIAALTALCLLFI